ncbi:MAG: amino acid adenylation domain-containing protein [Symploca sp. SIO2E9]|nr:amino acid adenylation domain-containing protein [Symploca sp. SIO2E9]
MNEISSSQINLSPEEKRLLLAKLLREKASGEKSVYPLSYGQQALWFLYQSAKLSKAYNVAFPARICSKVDVSALRQAFQGLVNRYATLRTTFKVQNGKSVQEVQGYQEVYFEQIDASTLTWEQLKEKVVKTYEHPFDLQRGPVFKVHLFTSSQQDHILLLTLHHIVYDARSMGTLLDDAQVLYSDAKAGRVASLPPLKSQYADYVQWQTQMLAGSKGEQLWNYWRQQLAGELPVLNLPTDRPRPPLQSYQGASYTLKLTETLTKQLRKLLQTQGVTLYTLLLAAFQVLLYRYTGQEDILVGSPTGGRSQAEFDEIVGYFVNPVVLRASFSGNPTFKSFLSQVRRTVLDAINYQDYPFSLLVEQLQPNRDPSRSPLFQVLFNFLNPQRLGEVPGLLVPSETPLQASWGQLELESFELEQQEGQFDLTLETVEGKDALFGVFKYNTDLFDAVTINRMAGHFQTLLEGIVKDPEEQVSKLPLLTEAEQHQLLVEWNNTQTEYSQDKCIHQLFEAQVERTPDAIAVVFEDQHLTYRELNTRANQLAHYLQAMGVGPEVLVGICVERSLEMVVGLLGILKAGGAYVPLDPAYPQERLAWMIEDSKLSVLLTQQDQFLRLPDNCAKVLCLDSDWGKIAQHSENNPDSKVASDNLAYIIYTSGSTGKPKGVQIIHRAVVNFLKFMSQAPGLTSQDVLLAVTTISFDIAVLELYLPITVGAKVLLARREVALDATKLIQVLEQSGTTIMQATPATWRMLLTAGWQGSSTLKILCGGEALSLNLANQLLDRSTSVWNMYGPTETTIWSAVYRVEPGNTLIPIGQPIANTQIYIVDPGLYQKYDSLQLVPVGQPGELLIGGVGLARGYLNRHELTDQKFVLNPFSDEPGARLYRTGDLARYLPDGNIECLGRIDHQVKINGFRIELGEIETLLSQHPKVKEAVVMIREDIPGDKRLAAYVVCDQEPPPTTSELRRFLKDKLPNYMIPSAFMFLEAMPLTPNGKVNRRGLPAPEGLRPELETTYAMPQTEVEQRLAEAWQQTLQLEKVGIHDNFFELGGNSLLMMQIHSKLSTIIGQELSIVEMFQYPTIHSLREYLSQQQNGQLSSQPSDDRGQKRRNRLLARKRQS